MNRAPPGLSSNHLHDNVREGDILAVRAPSGHFHLEPGNAPIVLIAGGIGVTPILSILEATLARGETRAVWVFYGVRNGSDHAMKAHMQNLAGAHSNVHLHVCYSRPRPGDRLGNDYHHHGHVDISLLRMTLPLAPYQFYVCGPRGMMESLIPALGEWGVAESAIHYEAFGPASLPQVGAARRSPAPPTAEPSATTLNVTFALSEKTLTWDGRDSSLLEFAEANGIRVDSGCRAGACGACETEIEDGEVVYDNPPDHHPQSGRCLLCMSRPARDLTLRA
ncbi:MAG: 2Fe-2S iron-sulfur cluster binding domain-containing protein [Alphaproteobacteria bacterium]|nr:2Fe-2S iron-sulfur cluster binding domain-containing protein [Alphaproteobacteria bacterium]